MHKIQKVMGDLHKCRMLNSPTMQEASSPSSNANKVQQIKADNVEEIILIQTQQIISGPAQTEQQTKEQVRYLQTKYTMNEVIL